MYVHDKRITICTITLDFHGCYHRVWMLFDCNTVNHTYLLHICVEALGMEANWQHGLQEGIKAQALR